MPSLEQIWWTNGVLRAPNASLAKALKELPDYTPEQQEIIVREAIRRLERSTDELGG